MTEVLPHELPLIFTNDFFYLSKVERGVPERDAAALTFFRSMPMSPRARYTKPYEYLIRKDRGGSTTLGLMHPNSQVAAAAFCDEFAETILSSCSASPLSLRYPSSLAKLSAKAPFRTPGREEAAVHTDADEDEEELSRIVSFFAYRDFNLLGKFYESGMFVGLEKKFSRMRSLDVSKCFHSIYTHSVSWAVKNKDLAKEHPKLYAFEQQFDLLMQKQNYNETNGIVIGPELSRVFAEVIFQRIDLNVIKLCSAAKLRHGIDFDIKRYVDDYFVFANSDEALDVVEEILSRELQFYKLHLNSEKSSTLHRPFVTPLSSAKRDIGRAIQELKSCVDTVKSTSDPSMYGAVSKRVRSKTQEARLIIGEHGVGFHNVSGLALTIINAMAIELVDSANSLKDADTEKANCIERTIWSILRLAFYIISLDIRVTSTYALANLLQLLRRKGYERLRRESDWIEHVVLKELIDLLQLSHEAFYHRMKRVDALETYNILIMGAYYFGESFSGNVDVRKVIDELRAGRISYFQYISLKFAMLKDRPAYQGALDELNASATERVISSRKHLAVDTEAYLLLCDLMSAPDLDSAAKRGLWEQTISSSAPSNARLAFVAARCGFVDWAGLRMERLLARRKLRPVYE